MHVYGTARTAVSFSGLILNNNKSNRIYLSASVSTLLIAILVEGSLLCDKYRSLTCELCKYYLSVPFCGLPLNILSISICFGKYL